MRPDFFLTTASTRHCRGHRAPGGRGILLGSLDVAPESQSTTPAGGLDSRPVFSNDGAARPIMHLCSRDDAPANTPSLRRLTSSGGRIFDHGAGRHVFDPGSGASGAAAIRLRFARPGSVAAPIWANRAGSKWVPSAVGGAIQEPAVLPTSVARRDASRAGRGRAALEYDICGSPPVKLTRPRRIPVFDQHLSGRRRGRRRFGSPARVPDNLQ